MSYTVCASSGVAEQVEQLQLDEPFVVNLINLAKCGEISNKHYVESLLKVNFMEQRSPWINQRFFVANFSDLKSGWSLKYFLQTDALRARILVSSPEHLCINVSFVENIAKVLPSKKFLTDGGTSYTFKFARKTEIVSLLLDGLEPEREGKRCARFLEIDEINR